MNINNELPPQSHVAEEFARFDRSDFAVVRFGQTIFEPKTHFVTSAQMMNTMLAHEHMQRLGYHRIGFVRGFHELHHFPAGYLWAQNELQEEQPLPLFTIRHADTPEQTGNRLHAWRQQTQPEADCA